MGWGFISHFYLWGCVGATQRNTNWRAFSLYLLATQRDDILLAKIFLERKCQFGDWNVSLAKLFVCTKGGRNKHPNFKAAEPFLSTSSGVPQIYFKILQVQFASFKGSESKCSDWTKCLPHPQTSFFSRMGIKLKFYYSPCSGCLQHLGKLETELAKVKSVYAEKVLYLYLISQQLDPLRIL